MALGKIITHPGVPNSTPVEYYLKYRGMADKYPIEEVSIITGGPVGAVRGNLKEKLPFGAIPALELKDGTVIDESNAILAYLEAAHPEGRTEGTDPKTIAISRQWSDRVEKCLTENGANAWRTQGPALALFKDRYPCLEGSHETFMKRVDHFLGVFETVVPSEGFLGGEKPIIADFRMVAGLNFLSDPQWGNIGGSMIEKYPKVTALFKRQKDLVDALQ
ncbi:hypothetical protein DIPPA_22545 [Diplonema papillatum]|nr:hypothetical protein DIPPA_22545 [Diplonema papillatum]|eukprot:gene21212-32664_t